MTMIIYRSPKRIALMGLIAFFLTSVIMLILYHRNSDTLSQSSPLSMSQTWKTREKTVILTDDESQRMGGHDTFTYSREMEIVFIGGMPRSGTTLLRVMLDSHPDIRCGGETRVIPRLLNMRNVWLKSPFESQRLLEAGISADVLDNAVGEFILEIIARHGRPAKRLCNKDPFTLKSAVYIRSIFPKSKFLYLIRDGRAVAHSIISRKVTISGFNLTDYRQCLLKWDAATKVMYDQCNTLGPKICHQVYYEKLVLHPEKTLRDIMKFLNLPWNESVLHHEQFVNQPDGIELSKLERSTDQVVKPINTEMLSRWVNAIPKDVVDDMPKIAPMLEVLGYNPRENPPNYGDPDALVVKKMRLIEDHQSEWEEKEKKLINQREELRNSLLMKTRDTSESSNPS